MIAWRRGIAECECFHEKFYRSRFLRNTSLAFLIARQDFRLQSNATSVSLMIQDVLVFSPPESFSRTVSSCFRTHNFISTRFHSLGRPPRIFDVFRLLEAYGVYNCSLNNFSLEHRTLHILQLTSATESIHGSHLQIRKIHAAVIVDTSALLVCDQLEISMGNKTSSC